MKKRFRLLILLLPLLMLLLQGCGLSGLSNEAKVTTLAVGDDGTLTHTIVSGTGSTAYAAELKQYIEKQIKDFQPDSKNGSVALKKCVYENGSLRAELTYSSGKVCSEFNGTDCFLGTIQEAEKAGYDFSGKFLDDHGNEADKKKFEERRKEWKVLIVSEAMQIRVPDKVIYTSSNMKTTGRLTAAPDEAVWEQNRKKENGDSQTDSVLPEPDLQLSYIIYK